MLPRWVHTAVQHLGFDVMPYDGRHFPELRRPELLQARQTDLVLDVGANEGHWAEDLRRRGYKRRIVSFEPLPTAYRELERRASADPNWETLRVALGYEAGAATFHVAGNSSSSSLLPMATPHVASAPESAYVRTERVEVRRLDDLAPELLRPRERIWLKVDVQGFELPVLRGAEQTLEAVDVVETELSLVELYEGQALLGEMISYLGSHGFGAQFLEPIFVNPASGELLQLDGVFVRRVAY